MQAGDKEELGSTAAVPQFLLTLNIFNDSTRFWPGQVVFLHNIPQSILHVCRKVVKLSPQTGVFIF